MQTQLRKQERPMNKLSRRHFVAASTAAVAAPYFVPASALGQDGRPAPSERIVMATIGWGMMGPGNTSKLMEKDDCQMVAACDIDSSALQAAKAAVDSKYGNSDCKAYTDFRELLSRQDIDAVTIAVPDHWHSIISIRAAESGKDIYGEKPLAHTFAEQQAIVAAVKANGRVWQTGSWQRSTFNFRMACELIRNGIIGKVTRIEVGLPAGHTDFAKSGTPAETGFKPAPDHIHYDMWVGPAQYQPYSPACHHKNWRWNYHFGGGQLLDWIGHHNDIAHWGMDWDDTGPLEVQVEQVDFPPRQAVWNTATKYRVNCKYPGEVDVVIAGGHPDIASGTKWIGESGWVHVDRGKFSASDMSWTKNDFDRGPVKLHAPQDHYRDFLDCIKSRGTTLAHVQAAHRSATTGHLALISMLTGRKIAWNAHNEQIIDDPGAAALLHKQMREPYTLAMAYGG
jgi:predicted dehydrogenase